MSQFDFEAYSTNPISGEIYSSSGSSSCSNTPSTPASTLSTAFLSARRTKCFSTFLGQWFFRLISCFGWWGTEFVGKRHYPQTHSCHVSFWEFWFFFGAHLLTVEWFVRVWSFRISVTSFTFTFIWRDFKFFRSFRWASWCWRSCGRKFVFLLILCADYQFPSSGVRFPLSGCVRFQLWRSTTDLIVGWGIRVLCIFVILNG